MKIHGQVSGKLITGLSGKLGKFAGKADLASRFHGQLGSYIS
jgi:hypothetical protein